MRAGCAFSYRLLGEIQSISEDIIKKEQIEEILNKFCSKKDVEHFIAKNELDSGFTFENIRFRANFYKTINGTAAVLRRVESQIPNMDQFNLPQSLYDVVDFHKGLVLVTGPTGSGKSTTLAAIINEINKTRSANIITCLLYTSPSPRDPL